MTKDSSRVVLPLDDVYRSIGVMGVHIPEKHLIPDAYKPLSSDEFVVQFKYHEQLSQHFKTKNAQVNPARVLKALVDLGYHFKDMGETRIVVLDAPRDMKNRTIPMEISNMLAQIHENGVDYAPNDNKFTKDSVFDPEDPLYSKLLKAGFKYCAMLGQNKNDVTDIDMEINYPCEGNLFSWVKRKLGFGK